MPQRSESTKRRPAPTRAVRAPKAADVPSAVLKLVLSTPWAISESGLQRVLAIASRAMLFPEALEQFSGEPLESTRSVTVRDGVATIPVEGVLVRRASWFDALCGAVSYETLAKDLRATLDDRSVSRILFSFDTPGGEVSGCSEFAQQIRAAKIVKPIDAYVGGDCMSAGYWLASQCGKIHVADTSLVGNLGVRMSSVDDSKRMKREGFERIEVISSQTPSKDHDPATEPGRARIQALVNQLASVFIASVAEGRGVSPETVLSDFGAGSVFVGNGAIAPGLADSVTTYEALLASFTAASRGVTITTEDNSMKGTAKPKAGAAAPRRAKASATRATAEKPDDKKDDEEAPAAEADAEGGNTCAECGADMPDGAQYCPSCGTAAESSDAAASADAPADDDEDEKAPSASALAAAATTERKRIVGILGYADRYPMTALMPLIEDASCTKEKAAAALIEIKPAAASSFASRIRALRGDESAIASAETKSAPTAGANGARGKVAARLLAHARVQPNTAPAAAHAAGGR